MAREYRILSRLPDALAFVPRVSAPLRRSSVIGVPFQIIEFRPGIVIRSHAPAGARRPAGAGARLSQVLLETIAAIHAVDTARSGSTISAGRRDSSQRAVAGWRKRGVAGAGGRHRGAARGARGMAGRAPGTGRHAGAAAQRFQAGQHDSGTARSLAGRGRRLGSGHARRSAVRFRHDLELLGAAGRSAGDARHGADADRRIAAFSRDARRWSATRL